MPTRQIPKTDIRYELVIYDDYGKERQESDGALLSERVCTVAKDNARPVTDVFFSSHGWKGDVPAALDQYDRWVGEMAGLTADRELARKQRPGFNPLIIGLHWPSLPFGDESVPVPGAGGVLSPRKPVSLEAEVERYASRIADTRAARAAIRVILTAAQQGGGSAATLTPAVRAAYQTLFAESGLSDDSVTGAPGHDQDGFDPAAIIKEASKAPAAKQPTRARAKKPAKGKTAVRTSAVGTPGVLGGRALDRITNVLVAPLQQLSFWRMKDRARAFGETGGHDLLVKLLKLAPAEARFHLMGHSFGCIAISATIAGPSWRTPISRPVHSLFLVQGALSLWSFAPDIPYKQGNPGYFSRILEKGFVRGPIITTRSRFDTAVGTYYPRGAAVKQQVVLKKMKYPKYGGTGTFGAQGLDPAIVTDLVVQGPAARYGFGAGRVYNVDCDRIIKDGGPPSGAHSDIAHPEIAHLFWQGALART